MSRLDDVRRLRARIELVHTSRRNSEVGYIDRFLSSVATLVEQHRDQELARALHEALDELGWLEPSVIETADSHSRILGVCRLAEVALRYSAGSNELDP